MIATLPYHDAPLTTEGRTAIIRDLLTIRMFARDMESAIRRGLPSDDLRNSFAQVVDRLAIAFPLPLADEID